MKTKRQVIAYATYLACTFVSAFVICNATASERIVLQDDVQTETLVVYNDKEKASMPKVVEIKEAEPQAQQDTQEENVEEEQVEEPVIEEASAPVDPIVFEGMTLDELAAKLDRSLISTLSGTGYLFASRSVELGIDPYLAVSIVLHETGCTWQCSTLVTQCNNVGGMKGSPGCGGGSYKAFATLEEGINSYMDNLYNNYYAYGLTTPELMNPKYAASTSWASQVRGYMDQLRAA